MSSFEMTSLAGYLPGCSLSQRFAAALSAHLKEHTELPKEYIETIEKTSHLPGYSESNEDGWKNKSWFEHWLAQLPEKKCSDPFQGAKQRLRVPLDPSSVRKSIYAHPMLPSDAETIAGSMALVAAGLAPNDVDLLMAASQVPDRSLPANASLLQHKLGLRHAGAYAIDTCCSSFVTLLELAASLIKSGFKNRILIVTSFIDSHVTDRSDYFSVVTGDAACAAVIEASKLDCHFISSASSSHGSRHAGIIYERRSPRLLMRTGTSPSYAQEFTTFFNMDICKEMALNAAEDLLSVATSALDRANLTTADIDFLVTHQPVSWAPEVWREAIGVSPERFQETFQLLGNIANCCVPANLYVALSAGKIQPGQKVMLASSGAGENHIAVLLKVSEALVNAVNKQGCIIPSIG